MTKWVKNPEVFSLSPLRQDALKILEAGFSAVDTKVVIQDEFIWNAGERTLNVRNRKFDFNNFENVYFVAVGKCAVTAAEEIEGILGDEITDGVVLDIRPGEFKKLRSLVGTHPLPSAQNMESVKEIAVLLEKATEKDLVLVIISGGGSALLASPYQMDLSELTDVFHDLTSAGAEITELNTVRKHLSNVTGGQLAELSYPATVANLLFSDVVGDDPSVIASGPFVKDQTTIADAESVLAKYNLPKLSFKETPKDDKYFKNIFTEILVNGRRGLEAMQKRAEELGYNATIETDEMQGEARQVGEELGARTLPSKSATLLSGETVVNVTNPHGEGGRNMDVALGALLGLVQAGASADRLVLACASDGRDNTDFAGAVADEISLESVQKHGLDPKEFLDSNNSKTFWERVGGEIITGPTGINVADFVLVLQE